MKKFIMLILSAVFLSAFAYVTVNAESEVDGYTEEEKENMILSAWSYWDGIYGIDNDSGNKPDYSILYKAISSAEESISNGAEIVRTADGDQFTISCCDNGITSDVTIPYLSYNRLGPSDNSYTASDYVILENGCPQINLDSADAQKINSEISDYWNDSLSFKAWTWNNYLFILTKQWFDGGLRSYRLYSVNLENGSEIGNEDIAGLMGVSSTQIDKWVECASIKAFLKEYGVIEQGLPAGIVVDGNRVDPKKYTLGIDEDGTIISTERIVSLIGPEHNEIIITLFGEFTFCELITGTDGISPGYTGSYAESIKEIPSEKFDEFNDVAVTAFTQYMDGQTPTIYDIKVCRYDFISGGRTYYNNRLYVLLSVKLQLESGIVTDEFYVGYYFDNIKINVDGTCDYDVEKSINASELKSSEIYFDEHGVPCKKEYGQESSLDSEMYSCAGFCSVDDFSDCCFRSYYDVETKTN